MISTLPIPDTFVVNIGDVLSYWSNDSFVSTAHTVLNVTGKERWSIPFSIGPNYKTVIEPLEECAMEGEKKYGSVKAGDYVFKSLTKGRYSEQKKYREIFGVKDGIGIVVRSCSKDIDSKREPVACSI